MKHCGPDSFEGVATPKMLRSGAQYRRHHDRPPSQPRLGDTPSCGGPLRHLGDARQAAGPAVHRLPAQRSRHHGGRSLFPARALPGFPVAAPVTWAAVERGVRPDAFTIADPPPGLPSKRQRAPWICNSIFRAIRG
jgi:hypothetical protein